MEFAKIKIKNPVFIASGIAGFGDDYFKLIDLNKLGGFITKTVTLNPREGNPQPRIIETKFGILNTIGLENPGIEAFIKEKLPLIQKKFKIPVIVSIGGEDPKEYIEMVNALNNKSGISGIELNFSCPNVNFKMIGQFPEIVYDTIQRIRQITNLSLIVKLTPAVSDIVKIAIACKEGGADGISLINTFPGLVFTKNGKKLIGGISGAPLKPIALKMVSDVAEKVNMDIMGVGGITEPNDGIEFFKCGAKAIGIGSGLFKDPYLPFKIINLLKNLVL